MTNDAGEQSGGRTRRHETVLRPLAADEAHERAESQLVRGRAGFSDCVHLSGIAAEQRQDHVHNECEDRHRDHSPQNQLEVGVGRVCFLGRRAVRALLS